MIANIPYGSWDNFSRIGKPYKALGFSLPVEDKANIFVSSKIYGITSWIRDGDLKPELV